MTGSGLDRVSLAAGIAVTLIGGLLCLDQLDAISIHDWATGGWSGAFIWPLALAVAGAALLWAGTRRPARTPDAPPYRTRLDPQTAVRPMTPAATTTEPDTETRILDLYRGGFGVALVVGAALLFLTSPRSSRSSPWPSFSRRSSGASAAIWPTSDPSASVPRSGPRWPPTCTIRSCRR